MTKLAVTRDWLKRLPNKLTLTRMAAVPVLLALYPAAVALQSVFLFALCALIFASAAITDMLDGYVARRYGAVTPLGALLDQIADKLLMTASLVLLVSSKAIPAFMAALLICRDLAINGIRLLALEQDVRIEVSDFGKWKTAILALAIFCLFINRQLGGIPFTEIGMVAMWVGLGLSLYSAWIYGLKFVKSAKILQSPP